MLDIKSTIDEMLKALYREKIIEIQATVLVINVA